jgi:hypothetical protein
MGWTDIIFSPFEWLSGLFVNSFADTMARKGFDDPAYKQNLQRLIERRRRFEESKE